MNITTKNHNKKILIISHGFNMDGRAASQTITDKIPYFIEQGYKLFVLSAITGKLDGKVFHKQLLPWGPNALRFDLRHWLRNKIGIGFVYKLLMFILSLILLPFSILEKIIFGRQSQWSWAIPAYLYSLKLIKENNITVIYSTGGAYSAHIAGLWLKKNTNIKWIAEIHDPMVAKGLPLKNRDKKFQAKLESDICKYADNIWWFTDGALNSAKERNPSLADKGFVVLPGANPPIVSTKYHMSDKLHFVHMGSISSTRSLLPFLKALDLWLKENQNLRSRIIIDIYGSSIDLASQEYISKYNLSDIVNCYGRLEFDKKTGKSGREQIIIKMFTADCLLLLHGEDPSFCREYIPSKLYEYFWVNRPILALVFENPLLEKLVSEHGGYAVDTTDISKIKNTIDSIFNSWSNGDLFIKSNAKPIGVKQAVKSIITFCKLKT